MVGMVIVSHSRQLAESLVHLVKQVASENAPIALAAGVGSDRQTFGTDAAEIMEAVEKVFSHDGVIILMDIGSAVLSAQMALDLLPPEISYKVHLCSAPLVEGAIAAAVQISLGSPLEMVVNEARQAINPKRSMINDMPVGEEKTIAEGPHGKAETITVKLVNLHGLHARPAARFVQKAAGYKSDITVKDLTNGRGPVSSRSLNAIATLGAVENHEILISATGEDAGQALHELRAIVEAGFGEPLASASIAPAVETAVIKKAAPMQKGAVQAIPMSDGYALGPLYRYEAPRPVLPDSPAGDPQSEWEVIGKAIDSTRQQIELRAKQLKSTLSADQTAIFEAHGLILQDPDMQAIVHQKIFEQKLNAAQAWDSTVRSVADNYRALSDPYLQGRSADVEDVGRQVLMTLLGSPSISPIKLENPVILFAEDLTPTETSQLDLEKVLGIITAKGGPTSHSAILARGLGIPAVSGSGQLNIREKTGDLIGLDGFTGEIWFKPSTENQTYLRNEREKWLDGKKKLLEISQEHAVTSDGFRVEVFANIGNVKDAQIALKNGAEGVGLLRTEFMFLTRETAPDEEEQYEQLRQIYQIMGKDLPITVRTMDVGGDKRLPYIDLPEEGNPFLGMRALRLSLQKPELLFMPQLRAILRAADGFPCRIMFPMVAEADEVSAARGWVEKAHEELAGKGISHAWPVELGIMVEIPSASLLSPVLAKMVDFFSIGTNDLTQYTMAAERGNPALAYLADGLNPAVLQLIERVCIAAHREGKWVGVCGELGGKPEALAILVGLGVDELSMSAPSIPRAKSIIRAMSRKGAQELGQKAVAARTTSEVHDLVKKFNLL
jgi:phosphocarrier protein FPr